MIYVLGLQRQLIKENFWLKDSVFNWFRKIIISRWLKNALISGSIGVASVLLGTAIIAQGSVYADTQSAPADSAENGVSSTGESDASGHTYVLKSS